MGISANIKTFATQDAKIDLGQPDSIDRVAIDMHKARLALDHFSLTRQFVQRDAAVLFRGDHRRHLIKIAPKFFECGANLVFV